MKYAELEMRNRQVNHARNLWDRAVTILPRVSQFWYKYTYMEEMLENVAGARQVNIIFNYYFLNIYVCMLYNSTILFVSLGI